MKHYRILLLAATLFAVSLHTQSAHAATIDLFGLLGLSSSDGGSGGATAVPELGGEGAGAALVVLCGAAAWLVDRRRRVA